ncbi:MAG: protein kinase [Acidobacteriota bacterium]
MTLQKLGRYEIVGELGKGAMGLVYLAKDPLIGRQLALKTFRLGFSAEDADREQFRARFLREAQSAGILSHPNIVTIHDVVVDDGGDFFIAMEYVKGTDLKQLMQRQGRLDVRFVIDIIAQIAEGLEYAHSKGVIHRDIKPANIILTADKQAKITDFGIARVEQSNLTVEGQLLGTPNYMAPEQIQGREVDHRADLFSLGVMLYEMVTGKKPFQGENLTMVTHRIVYDAFTPPEQLVAGLPGRLGAVLQKALEKEPGRRYSSGADMARDLRAVFATPARGEGGTASFLSPPAAAAPEAQPASETPAAPAAAAQTPAARAPYPLNPSAKSGAIPTLPAGTLTGQAPQLSTAAVREVEESEGRSGKNTALLAGLSLVAVALLAIAFFVLQPSDEPDAAPVDPLAELKSQYQPLVEKGQAALAAREPIRAIEFFDQALVIVPGDKEIRRLREEAERMILNEDMTLEEAMLEDRLAQAEQALTDQSFDTALELASGVLELDPESERASELVAEAEAGQEREREAKSRVQDRFRRSTAASAPPPPVAGPSSGAAGSAGAAAEAPSAMATLEIDFFSEVSEGILRVFNGGDVFYSEKFAFVQEKSGVFSRRVKTSGGLSHRGEIESGAAKLRIYVYRDGETETVEIDGNFPPEATRVLRIRVEKDGTVSVRLV